MFKNTSISMLKPKRFQGKKLEWFKTFLCLFLVDKILSECVANTSNMALAHLTVIVFKLIMQPLYLSNVVFTRIILERERSETLLITFCISKSIFFKNKVLEERFVCRLYEWEPNNLFNLCSCRVCAMNWLLIFARENLNSWL